jgi:hypothetical protein
MGRFKEMNREKLLFKLPSKGYDDMEEEEESDFYERLLAEMFSTTISPSDVIGRGCDCGPEKGAFMGEGNKGLLGTGKAWSGRGRENSVAMSVQNWLKHSMVFSF